MTVTDRVLVDANVGSWVGAGRGRHAQWAAALAATALAYDLPIATADEQLAAVATDRLQSATIEITNYHAFIRREKEQAAALTKKILAGPGGDAERFKETPGEMVRRVCRVFGNARDIVVLNDEAHHCYTPAPPEEAAEGGLDADERTEARRNAEEARVWFDGLRAVREKIGIRGIFDVSATPFFLKGSGLPGRHPPVSDDSMVGDLPRYRDLWVHVRDALPRKGLRDTTVGEGDPVLPKELEGALQSLYGDYLRSFGEWEGAGVHRRLLQHLREQARPRLDRGLRPDPSQRGNRRRARQAPAVQQRGWRPLAPPPGEPAHRLHAA